MPDSMFVTNDTLRDKTIKVGEIARAAAIFGVERIYIYRDATRNFDSDYEVARLLLEYMDTPQYLRKRLIPKRKELDFVGLLPPLRTPNHTVSPTPMLNEIREGVVVSWNGERVADVGSKELARFEGKGQEGQRLTFRVKSTHPLIATIVKKPEETYWGYDVRRAPSLSKFLRSAKFDSVILTSRLGEPLNEKWTQFCVECSSQKMLFCFGSPDAGIDKFLKQDGSKISDFDAMCLNLFPNQISETIRLEEAILGSLSIVNLASKLRT